MAKERLTRNPAGQVVLRLKTAYRDGTTHIVMSPLEFMQRLAALVPRPRLHLIRFHGRAGAKRQVARANHPEPDRASDRSHARAWNVGTYQLGAPAQARIRPRSRTLSAVRRQPKDHRGDRRAGADRAHSHASGLVGANPTASAGAALRSVSGGLIRGLEPAPTGQLALRWSGALIAVFWPMRGRKFSGKYRGLSANSSENPFHLTAARVEHRVSTSEKGRLNFVYAVRRFECSEANIDELATRRVLSIR